MDNGFLKKLSVIIFNAAIGLCWIIFVIAYMNPFNGLISNILSILFGLIYIAVTDVVLLFARNTKMKSKLVLKANLFSNLTEQASGTV